MTREGLSPKRLFGDRGVRRSFCLTLRRCRKWINRHRRSRDVAWHLTGIRAHGSKHSRRSLPGEHAGRVGIIRRQFGPGIEL